MLDADGNVVSPNELVARVEHLMRSTAAAQPSPDGPEAAEHQPHSEMTVAHTNALHVLQHQLVVPPIESPPGVAAPGKRMFKRVIRKFTWWYVEPRWRVQNDFDARFRAPRHGGHQRTGQAQSRNGPTTAATS